MPQMSPMWWMYMMLIFIMCLMMMNSLIYFNYLKSSTKMKTFKNFDFNWKW
uniref:ATP synthase F0 subunit 8 n=1 Tax=Apphia sp. 1 SJ-2023a TaxID=3040699 RepID=UPI002551D275|nr:ATP synthase F0 subunit 8 [Apphia sp. 1 SJ-2023a]WGC89433.1 ATP synthase F0 subunit 8 [Apphia sp. 1 SJ-2023a]